MSTSAVIMMLASFAIIWGGLIISLIKLPKE